MHVPAAGLTVSGHSSIADGQTAETLPCCGLRSCRGSALLLLLDILQGLSTAAVDQDPAGAQHWCCGLKSSRGPALLLLKDILQGLSTAAAWQSAPHDNMACHLSGLPAMCNHPLAAWQVPVGCCRADTLDPALLRPGRLDRKIEFPMPDRRQKRLVFQVGVRQDP